MARWLEILSSYNFEIIHRAGKSIPMQIPFPAILVLVQIVNITINQKQKRVCMLIQKIKLKQTRL